MTIYADHGGAVAAATTAWRAAIDAYAMQAAAVAEALDDDARNRAAAAYDAAHNRAEAAHAALDKAIAAAIAAGANPEPSTINHQPTRSAP